jgi:signal transduction histidine kinase
VFRSVRLRLIAYVVGVLAVVLLAVGALVYVLLTRQLDNLVDAQLRTAVSRGAFAARPSQDTGDLDGGGGVFQVRLVVEDARRLVRRPHVGSGEPGEWQVVSRSGLVPVGVPVQEGLVAARPGRDDLRTVTLGGERYRVLTRVAGTENQALVAAQVGVPLAARDRQGRVVLLALAGGGAAGLALTVVGGFFLTGRALAPAREAFAQQRRFVADASHELRTPLALLRLEAEDLAQRLDTPGEARGLIRQVDRIGRLVEGLLSLARLDEDPDALEREPVPVQPLLDTAREQAVRLAASGVRVECSAPPDLWVSGDPDRLRQVLLVLVDNACRATPAGGSIRLSAVEDVRGVLLTVEDSGPGIPAEHLTYVFERFYRVDKARSRESGGAGLGLSIAREIVRLHGGEIWLESEEGRGTRACVRLEKAASPG